jgi:hypothetical protein
MQWKRWWFQFLALLAVGCFSACSSGTQPPDAAQPETAAAGANAAQPNAGAPTGRAGNMDIANCDEIAGWAWDSNQPTTPVRVNIYDGTALLTTIVAGELRDDLREKGVGDGKHGFKYPVPASLKDGKAHAIRAEIADTKFALQDAARIITCPPK